MAIWEVSVPEIRNRRARENAAHQRAEAVCDNGTKRDPACETGSSVDEEAEELAEDGAFHAGESEVVDDDADPEWLST